ncbi:MAG: endo-1,4-beta-xylanase [Pyrinomonadaceae bacterium]|nr:endo-1,4-beta-xylanase [Phycisphaerales bacterium]
MLSFAVHDNDGNPLPARELALRNAYLLGPDDVPVQADVRVLDGLIRCEKRSSDSAAICLQVPVGVSPNSSDGSGVGVVVLQTCLLPEREAPYVLSLELARHRLMLILNKLEDWALFDLSAEDPVMKAFEAARLAFTRAVVATGGGASAGQARAAAVTRQPDKLGREALALALEASELLTLKQSTVQHTKRMNGELVKAAAAISTPDSAITDHEAAESRNALIGNAGVILPSPPQIGCIVGQEQFSPQLQKIVGTCCDFIGMPMRWIDMEPTEGKYSFAKTDRWIEWAVRTARVPIVGGPVIDFRPRSVPEWLYIWEHDYETLRELVYEHVKTIVTRYRRTVGTWVIVSGLHVNTNFTFSFEQVMDLTRMCVMVVRKLQPSAKVVVEIDVPWGEYYSENPRSIPPMLYAEMVSQAGVNADLFGLRIDMGMPEFGRWTRDLMALSALLDRYAGLERPLCVSACSAPSEPLAAGPGPAEKGSGSVVDPGYWRTAWTPEAQCRWLTHVAAVATSKPYVHSFCWNELYDTAKSPGSESQWRADGLITASGQPKLAMFRLAEIRQALKEKRSPLTLPAVPTTPGA